MGKNNYPTKEIESVNPEQITEMVTSLIDLRNKGKPRDNNELRKRIDEYFMFCQNKGWRPGIEGLACALGISRQTVFYWSHGLNCDNERAEIMQETKQAIDCFLEQCLLSGKISPPSGIFLAKNWLGYKDQISLEQTIPEQPKRKVGTLDDLKALMLDLESNKSTERTEREDCYEKEN